MFNLLVKDILIQKKMVLISPFYALFFLLVFRQPPMSEALYIMSTIAIVYILTMYASAYDDKNRSEVLLNSLPVKRRDIVLAKYLSIFLYTGIGLAASVLIAFIAAAAGFAASVRPVNMGDVAGSLAAAVFLNAVYYPLYFRFGSIKVRIINMFLFLAIFFLPAFLTEYLKAHYGPETLQSLLIRLSGTPGWIQGIVLAALFLALLLGSLALSLRIYENKEF